MPYDTAQCTAVSPLDAPCPRCQHPGPGAGPHYARLVCGQCGAFLRWLPRPRLVAQAVQP